MKGYHQYKSCIEACLRCAAICHHCASSCTQEEDVKMMAKCIELDMQCAAICEAAATVMSIGSSQVKALCNICAAICRECGQECSKHQTEHCSECAAACNECASECERMVA